MNKDNISREEFKQNILREIVLRIDYTGVIIIDETISLFTEKFKTSFSSYETTFLNRIDLGSIRIDEISENLSIPVKELEKQTVHRFTKNLFGTDEVVFDISKYYSFMHIKTNNYLTIDPYLNFFSEYINFLNASISFLSIKRFGLRKISTNIYSSIEDLLQDFEQKYFYINVENGIFQNSGSHKMDLLTSEDGLFNFTFKRIIDKGFQQEPGQDIKEAYQVLLDIDGYITEDNIRKINFLKDAKSQMSLINSKYLFELFKISMTDSFLSKNRKI